MKPSLVQDFDPEISVNSGQVFLWERIGDNWYGIHGDHVVRFSKSAGPADFASFPESSGLERSMFRLEDDASSIFAEISKDALVGKLVKSYKGLRLMRQEPEQCLFSFVCASNTNIPMIRRMLYALAKKFGSRVIVDGKEFWTFPQARTIHGATEGDLRACGLGYRARALKAVAHAISTGSIDLELLKKAPYEEARQELLKVFGVGPKIADCVLLFSLEKLDAFPIDIWIARALSSHYSWISGQKFGEKLTARQYEALSDSARLYFGRHAGYAQQYLYYHMRQGAGRRW
jgi:N-glycosylase/DNA lyase